PESQKSVNIELRNDESSPSLIQSWIDTGDENAEPDTLKVPFIITPPITRIEPNSGQTLRVMYTGENLPKDRESIFWLNVLDIPAKPKKADNNFNYLQLAVRSRIKLFYRPNGLKVNLSEAYKNVEWKINQNASEVTAVNNTPYYITYSKLSLISNDKVVETIKGKMVPPFSSEKFH
ncbi:fimbria/pilus periplasmic chaperone, partial [Salmonella enterica subsp. enterica]|nr:fimbria/pilus periplasmic chaperone [Salmonella enterica subsp. enterica]